MTAPNLSFYVYVMVPVRYFHKWKVFSGPLGASLRLSVLERVNFFPILFHAFPSIFSIPKSFGLETKSVQLILKLFDFRTH